MSKRYGRNQKRKHRERIANLEYAHQMDAALLRHQRDEINGLQSVIDRAADIAGEMSILFPAENVEVNQPSMPTWEVMVTEKFSIHQPIGSIDKMTYQTQRLNVMLGRIEPDAMRMATHFMIRFGDKRWGYAISENAIVSTPKHHMVRMVTEQLGRVIGTELQA